MIFLQIWFSCGLGAIYLSHFHDYFYSDNYTFPNVFSFDFFIISVIFLALGPVAFFPYLMGWVIGNGNFEIITELKIYRRIRKLWKNNLKPTSME